MDKIGQFFLAPKSILDRVARYDPNLVKFRNLAEKDATKEKLLESSNDPIINSIENSLNTRELLEAKKEIFSDPTVKKDILPAQDSKIIEGESEIAEKLDEKLDESHADLNQHYPSKQYVYESLSSLPKSLFDYREDYAIIEKGRVISNSDIRNVISNITKSRSDTGRRRVPGQTAVLRALAAVDNINIDRVSLRPEVRNAIEKFKNIGDDAQDFTEFDDLPSKV